MKEINEVIFGIFLMILCIFLLINGLWNGDFLSIMEKYEVISAGDLWKDVEKCDWERIDECDANIIFSYNLVCTDSDCIGGKYLNRETIATMKYQETENMIKSCYNDRKCTIDEKNFIFNVFTGRMQLVEVKKIWEK